MVHHAAFEQRNPKHLTPIYSSIQASITAIIQQILQTIIADGVKLEAPALGGRPRRQCRDRRVQGSGHGADQADHGSEGAPSTEAAPGVPIREQHVAVRHGNDTQGDRAGRAADGPPQAGDGPPTLSLEEFAQKQNESLAALRELAERANARKQNDPVLIDYQQQNGGGK
ncbi:hypothetical protein [Paludibacterium denitrificans]|uniref:Uncharacterized protein n=1 Tax=Paludibacterium denitrificans TaxID=2675226 RepID=A0A844G9U5_9NEIS|nr:hypothetical protein [Paludibacterium denitrificans]MTD32389.1 hypothetical protein [Paludibacterium denitrificans]